MRSWLFFALASVTLVLHSAFGTQGEAFAEVAALFELLTLALFAIGFALLYGADREQLRSIETRAELDPMYAKLAMWMYSNAGRQLAREERSIGEASVAIALGTDSYERRFAHPLDAAISLATVGQSGASSLVHIVYGIPGEHLTGRVRVVEGDPTAPGR